LKLSLDNLDAQLAGNLLPVYVISGDEPLLCGEAADAVRAAARARGFAEREVLFVERGGSTWEEVLRSAQALSLFAARRVIEVRMPSGKPGSGAAALARAIEAAGDDLLLLIVTGRLDRAAQNAEWLSLAQQRGGWLPVWPVELARFPGWLRQRARQAGMTLDDEAVALLAERTEGNLLAARQELDKLALLLGPAAKVRVDDVAASSSDSARFSVFQLGDAIGAGEASRALRILDGLRSEGEEAVLVLWSLLRALSTLQSSGDTRRRRVSFAALATRAVRADRMAKGLMRGAVWDEMALLAAELCGLRLLPLTRRQLRLQGGA